MNKKPDNWCNPRKI